MFKLSTTFLFLIISLIANAKTKNIANFCKDLDVVKVVADRTHYFKSSAELDAWPGMKNKQIDVLNSNFYDLNFKTLDEGSAWLWIQIPSEIFQRKAIDSVIPLTDLLNVSNELRSAKTYEISSDIDARINAFITSIKDDRKNGYRGGTYSASVNNKAYLGCLKYGEGINSGCAQAVDEMVVKNAPSGNFGLFFEDIIDEILRDPTYSKVLNPFAAHLIDLYLKNSLVKTNLMDEMTSAFIQAGFTETEAIERVMKVMAFTSLQGPEMFRVVSRYLNDQADSLIPRILNALHLISTIPSILDLRQINAGKNMYSLPPSISSSCFSGKYYHFWMAAYWGYKLAKQFNESPAKQDSAMKGVWLVAVSYHKFSQTYGRNPFQALTISADSHYVDLHRRDLSYYASGITFGQDLANKNNLNWCEFKQTSVDNDLHTLLQYSKPTKPLHTQDEINLTMSKMAEIDFSSPKAILDIQKFSKEWDHLLQVDQIFPKK